MKKSTTKRTKASKNSQTNDKISALMTKSLIALRELVDNDEAFEIEYFQVVSVFLQGVISTAVDLAELHSPGAAPFIYADIESLAKSGGLYNNDAPRSRATRYLPKKLQLFLLKCFVGRLTRTLIFYIITQLLLISMFPNCAHKITFSPKLAAP